MKTEILKKRPKGLYLPPGLYSDLRLLRTAFIWLTSTGAGRRFGSLPIGWYQAHQCACIEILQHLALAKTDSFFFRFRDGQYQVYANDKWIDLITNHKLFEEADKAVRK